MNDTYIPYAEYPILAPNPLLYPLRPYRAPVPFHLGWTFGLVAGPSAVLLTAVLMILGLWCYKKLGGAPLAPPPPAAADVEMQPPALAGPVGVDPALRNRIPQITFSSASSSSGTATVLPRHQDLCVICLSEFVDGDTISTIPGCMHVFHAQCLNHYMDSFSTCPCCRTTIVSGEESGTAIAIEEEEEP